TDPVKGEVYQPVFVVPAATLAAAPGNLLFRKVQEANKNILLQVTANKRMIGNAEIHARSASYDLTKKDSIFTLARNTNKTYPFTLNGEKMDGRKTDNLFGSAHYTDNKVDQYAYMAMRSINYEHIPSIRYFYADAIKIINVDLKTYGKKIGYIVGAGDKVPDALEQMGYEVTLLTEK